MNQREAKQAFGIPHYTYSEKFLDSTRELRNLIGNFTRAMERLRNAGKTN